MSKIRAVIFDCYGTLIDIQTNEGKEEVFHYLSMYLEYYGAHFSAQGLRSAVQVHKEKYLKTIGKRYIGERYPEIDLEAVFGAVLRKEGLDSHFLAESCCKLFRALSRERLQLFPDSLPILREMKRKRYPLAVVADAQKVFSPEECGALGLHQFFDHFVFSTQFGFAKPDPRLFAIACSLLEVQPAEAVYIGDNPKRDILGAKRIGMKTILLNRSPTEKPQDANPDFCADNLWLAWEWIKERS